MADDLVRILTYANDEMRKTETPKMQATSVEGELLPLDQIRQAEAEVTRQIASAHEMDEKIIENARTQALQIKSQARETGQRIGQKEYQAIIARAEEEATRVIAQANQLAESLRYLEQQRIETAVRHAIHIVIGSEEGQ